MIRCLMNTTFKASLRPQHAKIASLLTWGKPAFLSYHTPPDQEAANFFYYHHNRSIYNLPVDSIRFEVDKTHFPDNKTRIVFKNPSSGVTARVKHITPWCVVAYSRAGHMGNWDWTAKPDRASISPPQLRKILLLNDSARDAYEVKNDDFKRYSIWLNAIYQKYFNHLVEHMDDYPALLKMIERCTRQSPKDGDPATHIQKMMSNGITKSRMVKGRDGESDPSTAEEYISLEQKVYEKSFDPTVDKFLTSYDADMYRVYKLVRTPCPIYDSVGNVLPVTVEAPLGQGDVVSCDVQLEPFMNLKSGRIGIVCKLQSTTILNKVASMQPRVRRLG